MGGVCSRTISWNPAGLTGSETFTVYRRYRSPDYCGSDGADEVVTSTSLKTITFNVPANSVLWTWVHVDGCSSSTDSRKAIWDTFQTPPVIAVLQGTPIDSLNVGLQFTVPDARTYGYYLGGYERWWGEGGESRCPVGSAKSWTQTVATPGLYTFALTTWENDFGQGGGATSFTINTSCSPATISPTTLPNAQVGVPYSQALSVAGAVSPAFFCPNLPGWLSLNPTTGLLSGTPVAPGWSTFDVTVNDANWCRGRATYTITVGGQCSYSLAPMGVSVPSAGAAQQSFQVQTGSGCAWTATSNAGWITVTGGSSGAGTGAVTYSVAANGGPSRSGTITAGGQVFTVTQEGGCGYTLNPSSASVPAAGAAGQSFQVQTGSGCAWTATSNAGWITVTGGSSGAGTGAVTYSVAANGGPSRSGTITAGGQVFTVTQEGGCGYALNPSSASVPAAGAAGQAFQVQTGSGCAWTAASTVGWITLSGGFSGSGPGLVSYSVAPNPGEARVGSLVAAGLSFLVSQAAGPPQITGFTASPQTVQPGERSTLQWTTTGGTSASIDNGVGPVPVSGSVLVGPFQTTTYTLSVTGPGGTVYGTATVAVAEQGLSLSPASLTMAPGSTATVTAALSPVRTAATTLALSSSDTTVAQVPPSLTIGAGVATGTLVVTALDVGTALVRAALPPELGGGSVSTFVTVSCPAPSAPVVTGPTAPLPAGSVFSLTWTDALGQDATGGYEAQLALDAGFSQLVSAQRVSGRSAAFSVPPTSAGAVYARVRAIAGCGAPGAFSSVVSVAVARAPAAVILTQGQTPAWSVTRGAALPQATLRFRNVGETGTTVSFLPSTGSVFFIVTPTSASLPEGQEVVVTLTAAPGATSRSGLQQGAVTAAWSGGAVASPVTLTVADSAADVVPDVDRDTVYNLASGGGVSIQTLRVTNPGSVPITLGGTIGPGGGWLSVEPLDLADPLLAGETRSVRVRIDRSKRTASDGEPPVFTLLELRAVGADRGRLVHVYDAEPPVVSETTSRPAAQSATPTFIIPAAVHAAGAQNALFTSDGWIRNLSGSNVTVDLLASPRGGGASLKAEKTLPGLSLVSLYDFVQGVFGRTDLAANVEIRPKNLSDAAQLVVRVTTEGQPAGGKREQRYSSEIPVYASAVGTGVGRPALVMPGIDVTENVRTNIIFSETAGAGVSVNLSLRGADGVVIGRTSAPVYVPPYGIVQDSVPALLQLPGAATVQSGSLRIEGAAGSGRLVALGTAIDNVSQSFRALSASTVPPEAQSRPSVLEGPEVHPVVIPSIVHQAGINAFFTTRLEVSNETATPASLRFVYTYGGKDEGGQQVSGEKVVEQVLPGRRALPIEVGRDAVVNLLGMPASWNTSGPLRIEGPGLGQVIVGSWVLTPSDVSRPDQNVKFAEFRGYSATSPEVVGIGGTAVALSSGVSKRSGLRTNLILTEVTGQPAQVRVKLVDGVTGLQIGASDPIRVPPYQKVQVNNAELWSLLKLPDGERDRMQLVLEAVGTEGGRVAGVLTQIENASNATLVTPFAPAGPQGLGIGAGR